jgi:Fe-S-cluster containining protein
MTALSQRDRGVLNVVLRCYDWMDRQWTALLEKNAELSMLGEPKIDVACRKGCAACCTYVVDIFDSEAATIAVAIQQAEDVDRIQALFQLLAWEHEWNAWLDLNPMPSQVLITKTPDGMRGAVNPDHMAWRVRWQIKRKACAFLNMEDYSCSIYDLRPATCRGHHAAYPPTGVDCATPPDGCFTSQADVERGWPQSIYQINNELGEQWSMVLAQNLQRNDLPWKPGQILPIAVLEAGRARFNWPGPMDVGVTVPILETALKPIQLRDLA